VDDEQTEPHPAGGAYRAWPECHGGGYPPGWHIRYRYRGRPGRPSGSTPVWRERVGTVAGHSLRDEHTSTTWIPVRPRGCAADTPVSLVRATDVLDGRPPGSAGGRDDPFASTVH
jgi:hypothetical protein